MTDFSRIPLEMQSYIQWVVWKYEAVPAAKPTKVPYNPKNGFHASVNDRHTWASFDEAVNAVVNGNGAYAGIGFVFTKKDPFCGIDLDDCGDDPTAAERQLKIFNHINSYAERSPSGKGLHIITKASVPGGRKRSLVEIYSEQRYFTMTGDVYHDVPIQARQTEVMDVWGEMGATADPVHFVGDIIQRHDDAEVYRIAAAAKNGDLFERLWNGDWSGYPSNADGSGSSEADFALVDIISFHTRNRIQIQRMFEASALGKRAKYAKANPGRRATLIGYMINKSFDNVLPPVDLSTILDRVNTAAQSVPSAETAAAAAPSAVHTPTEFAPAGRGSSPAPPSLQSYDGYDLTLWQREFPNPRSLIGGIAKFV